MLNMSLKLAYTEQYGIERRTKQRSTNWIRKKKPKRGTKRKCNILWYMLIGVTMFMHLPYIMANKWFTLTHNSKNNNIMRRRNDDQQKKSVVFQEEAKTNEYANMNKC